jgi:hypothetical protein
MTAAGIADGTLSAVVWPTHVGLCTLDAHGHPVETGDRAQIRWELVNGQPVGSAALFVTAGDYTHLVYAHGPVGLLAVSHCAPLPHPLHWPVDQELVLANIGVGQPI